MGLNKWTSVKDDIPIVQENEDTIKVIVCYWDEGMTDDNGVYPDGYNGEVTEARYCSGGGFMDFYFDRKGKFNLEYFYEDVTHWMYYPKPPTTK